MSDYAQRYDIYTAAAWIRGYVKTKGGFFLTEKECELPLKQLREDQLDKIIEAGERAGLKLYPFKNNKRELPRVHKVMGFLHSIQFETLLDVGSGRGVFLLPFIKEFPWVRVTAMDIQEKKVAFLNELSSGGFENLYGIEMDICANSLLEKSYDVVTLLEVLEHIPRVEKAVKEAVKIAKHYVIVTVPSKPDNNPEHIHFLTKDKLTELFENAGCKRLHYDGVMGHLFLVAVVD